MRENEKKKLLTPQEKISCSITLRVNKQNKPRCNCRIKNACLMKDNCVPENMFHLAITEVESKNSVNKKRIYIGATENEWKKDFITIA